MTARKSLSLTLSNVYETLAICWPTVLDAARGQVTKEVCDDRLTHWSARLIENAGIRVNVAGREHLEPGRTYLVMSNHQSLYDVPVLFHALGANIRMIAKKELFRVPVFGHAMREAGFISIDRSDRASAIESLRTAKDLFDHGTHVWIAPEGTRSKSGALLPFKRGGFVLAREAEVPILPVSLRGTRNVLRAKGLRSVPGAEVLVTIHSPIDPIRFKNGNDKASRDRLIADVRKAIESAI